MRVLAGGPARETTSALYELHRHGLEVQSGFGLAKTEEQFEVVVRHEIVPDPGGPRWHDAKIEAVAKVRQGFLRRVLTERSSNVLRDWNNGTDDRDRAVFMVDTDVILGPGVLERMWAVDADVVYGVFWTDADWGQPVEGPAPQVWRCHPYNFDRETWEALTAKGVNEVEVYGGGACTLIRGRGFESRYWPLLESIRYNGGMWGGEDRTFALGLETRGIQQVAVTGLPIYHCHHEHQQTAEGLEVARKEVGL